MSNKIMLTMLASFVAASAAVAAEPTLKDLAPQKQDPAKVQERIDNENMKRLYEQRQADARVKSEAERNIDRIPKTTTVMPSYPLGVTVTIPTK